LANITPAGKRAAAVAADNMAELLGLLRPGDYVDVVAILTLPAQSVSVKQTAPQQTIIPVFQNVLVLAVGKETGIPAPGQKEKREDARFVSLSLTPNETNILAFLQEQGKIRLVMRSANDTQVENVKPITWDDLFEYLPGLKKEEKKGETIEIYRGLNKEELPISE
jgi:Flp pilus assembly protein CpaB